MTTVLMLDGTWSRPGARSEVAVALRDALPSWIGFEYVDYAAAFGLATGVGDLAYAESVADGVHATVEAVHTIGGRIILVGYSQGMAVALTAAMLMRRGEVAAVAGLGDPHQPVHHGRSGIAGAIENSQVPCPRFSIAAPGDPIADLPLGSPLRSIADLGAWMSVRDLASAKRWGDEMLADIADLRRMQQWWRNPAAWAGLLSAGSYVAGYLGTRHTKDYVSGGHVARLARQIEVVA